MKNYPVSLRRLALLALIPAFSFLASCDDDEPEAENESETITTVRLTFTPQGGGSALVFTAKDADGDGPGAIAIDPISLAPGTTYSVQLALLNELESPAEDIGEEVEEEAEEHQLFYTVTPAPLASIAYADADANGLPIGLATTWTTSASALSGQVTVTLKHQPDIKSATSTVGDGETDVAVTFSVSVQ
jgi:hypothetical protein